MTLSPWLGDAGIIFPWHFRSPLYIYKLYSFSPQTIEIKFKIWRVTFFDKFFTTGKIMGWTSVFPEIMEMTYRCIWDDLWFCFIFPVNVRGCYKMGLIQTSWDLMVCHQCIWELDWGLNLYAYFCNMVAILIYGKASYRPDTCDIIVFHWNW